MFSFGGGVALKKQTEAIRTKLDYDYLVKLVLIGDHSVGKSCLLVRFVDDAFYNDQYVSTIGCEFKCRTLEVDGRLIKLQLWDTTGQERYRSITSSYYRGAQGLMIMYDVTNRNSFDNVRKWMEEAERHASANAPIILLATKADRDERREVTKEEGQQLAHNLGISFMETSARTNLNVQESFMLLSQKIIEQLAETKPVSRAPPTTVSSFAAPPATDSLSSIPNKIYSFFSGIVNSAPPASTTAAPSGASNIRLDGNDSDNESFDDDDLDDAIVSETPKANKKEKAGGKKHLHQKTDVNIFKLDLSKLTAEGQVMTGDPMFCMKCAVVLNNASKIKVMQVEELKEQNSVLFTKNHPVAYCGVRDLFFAPEGYVPSDVSAANTNSTTTTTTTTTAAPSSSSSSSSSTTRDTQNYDNLPPEVRIWTCEFCDFHNLVAGLNDEELPKSDTIDYVITPATVPDLEAESQNIVFCVDVSGSMCVTTEVADSGALKGILKGTDTRDAVARTHASGAGDQKLPSERRGVKYVSRLQCVQAAIEQHIANIKKTNPHYKIGLISFNDEVTIVGDGTQDPLIVAGDKLDSFDSLKEIGEKYTIGKSVHEAEKDLLTKLWALQENGCTALGPALLLGILIAGSKPASKVILCTDGLANFGIGSMDGERATEFTPFYTELAEIAKVKGVTVSIISMAAEDCSLENLSIVTEQTRGEVERVDASSIASNFQSILMNPIIATGCMATIFLHKGLMFRNEMDDEFETDENLLRKDLGNVTADTECTFSYGFRPKTQIDLSDLTEVPFQVQLVFSKLNGMKCLRVATASIKLTEDRDEAEKAANITVIGTHAAQRAAKYAKDGDFERAQMETRAAKRFMNRNNDGDAKRSVWATNVAFMDDVLINERKKEKETGLMGDKEMRKKGLKQHDAASVAITKTKVANTNALFS